MIAIIPGLSFLGSMVAVIIAAFLLRKVMVILVNLHRRICALRAFPWAKCHWLLGTLKYFPGPGPEGMAYFREQAALFPRLLLVWYGPIHHSLALHQPETIKTIMKTSEPKNHWFGGYRNAHPWLGGGLLLSGGRKWARNRRLLTPAFHFDVLKHYITVKNRATDTLLVKLSRYGEQEDFFELFSHISLCTLDIILRCAFSYDNDCQTRGVRHPYVQAVKYLTEEMVERVMLPWLHPDFIYFKTRRGREFRRKCEYVHSVARDIIDNRRKALQGEVATEHRHLDFLDILLTARDDAGLGLSDIDIRQEVNTFLFAGHDTTASAITWTLYELSHNMVHQERCRQEVDELLSDRSEEVILWGDLSKLKYLTMCIKEALRLHTPVPVVQRQTTRDHIVDEKLLPAGTVVDLHLYMLHHNPQVWPDSQVYDPDRFSAAVNKTMGPYDFLPFSAGPRNCIGQHFAMDEIKVVIARILHKFAIVLHPDHAVGEQMSVVVRPQNGIRVKVIPR